MKTLSKLLLIAAFLFSVSAAVAERNPTLVQLVSPKRDARVTGSSVTLTVSLSKEANLQKFKALLNGQDITTLFAESGSCSANACSESATVSTSNGLRKGENLISLRVEGQDHHSSFFLRSDFRWSPSATTTAPTPPGVGIESSTDMPSTYAFKTLLPGGPNGGNPWFSISTNGLHPFTQNYPANGIDCSGSTYMVIAISRSDLSEVEETCQNAPLTVSQYTIQDFVVVGTTFGHNADRTLDTTAIGGTDFSKVSKDLVPAGYMAVGYGPANSSSGPPPPGTALESYYLTPSETGNVALPQVQGLLSLDGWGLYDINSSENISFSVDAIKGVVQIGGATYTRPDISSTATGFWLLKVNRRTLQNATGCTSTDKGVTYPNCGTLYTADDTGISQLLPVLTGTDTNDSPDVNQRNLMILVAWGQQPGMGEHVSSGNAIALAQALEGLGGSRYSLDDMNFFTDAYVIVTSSDPVFAKDFGSQQVLTSNTANVAQGQTGQLAGTLARDNHYLYRPAYANIAHLATSPVLPGDPNLAVIAWAQPADWPMMDTDAHKAAYQKLSGLLLTDAKLGDTDHSDDVRYYYTSLVASSFLLSLDPGNQATFPYPGDGNGFTEQDWTDVGTQLHNEFRDMSNATTFFDTLHTTVIGDSEDGAAFEMMGAISDALKNTNADSSTQISPVWSNILNAAGAIASVAGTLASASDEDEDGVDMFGVVSGSLWLAGSAGIMDKNNNGVPTKDWSILVDAKTLSDNFVSYMQRADATFAEIQDNVYSDWNKLDAVSSATQNQWRIQDASSLIPIVSQLELGAKRYFYMTLFKSMDYKIDQLNSSTETVQSGMASQAGSVLPPPHACKSLDWSDSPQGWYSSASYPTKAGNYDMYVIGGSIHNNYTDDAKEDHPPADLMETFFGANTQGGEFDLPGNMFFVQGGLPLRVPPSYMPYPNHDDVASWCTLGTPSQGGFSNLIRPVNVDLGQEAVTLSGTISNQQGNQHPAAGAPIYINAGSASVQTTTSDDAGNFAISLTTKDLPVGSYPINYTFKGDTNVAPTYDSTSTLTVGKGTASFSKLTSSQTIPAGTATISLLGSVASTTSFTPTGTVTATINGMTSQPATVAGDGSFSITFNTQLIPSSATAYPITYVYSGDSDFPKLTDSTTNLTVTPVTTTTVSIDSPGIPWWANYSSPIPIVAYLFVNNDHTKPVTAGTVNFYDDGVLIPGGPFPVNAGGAGTKVTYVMPVGVHTYTAVYSGATGFDPGTSPPMTLLFEKQTAKFSGLASPPPIPTGTSSVPLQGAIFDMNGNVPHPEDIYVSVVNSSNVTVASTSFGTTANGFSGVLDTSKIPPSYQPYTIVYTYYADSYINNLSDSSTHLYVNFLKSGTSLSASSNGKAITYGEQLTLTASVADQDGIASAPTATGTVTFFDGSTVLGTVNLSSGTAKFTTTTPLAAGTHSLSATYKGNSSYGTSTSTALNQVVNAPTTTAITSSLNPSAPNQLVTFTATVAGKGSTQPTGYVDFKLDGNTELGSIPLQTNNGVNTATFDTTSLAIGSHTITAAYQGDSTFAASQASLTQTVKLTPVFSGLTNPAPITAGTSSITLKGKITAGASFPPGTVQVTVGPASGSGPISATDGSFSITVNTARLAPSSAPYTITYSYAGSDAFNPATDSTTRLTVSLPTSTTTLTSSSNPSDYRSTVTFTAAVSGSGSPPSGSVTFEDGSTTLGRINLSQGKASLSLNSLSGGTHTITAVYSGNPSYQGSTSNPLSQKVNPLTPTFSGLTVPQPVAAGTSSLTLKGKIAAGSVIPTGNVAITVGANGPGANPKIGADGSFSATINISQLAASSTAYTITYSFAASTNFNAASDNNTSLTVTPAGAVATTTTIATAARQCISGTPFQMFITVTPQSKANGTPIGLMQVNRVNSTGQLDPTWQLKDYLDTNGQYNPDVNGNSDTIPAGTWTFVASFQPTDATKFQPSTGQLAMTCTAPPTQSRRR